MNIARMMNMLPESDQLFAQEFIWKLVLAWDPDFKKATPDEMKSMEEAEKSRFIPAEEIDWNDLGKYAQWGKEVSMGAENCILTESMQNTSPFYI